MDQVNEFVRQAVKALQDGFLQVNQPWALVIALIAVILMSSWRSWFPMALLATLVLVAVKQVAPALINKGKLPDDLMQQSFWTPVVAYFIGFVIIIGVFFFFKSMVFRSKAAAH